MTATVCVVGLGYIGLPTAATLARAGHRVVGVDINPATLAAIAEGRSTIVEPDLGPLVESVVRAGALTLQMVPTPADVFIICVPTPFEIHGGTRQPDLSHVLAAARAIAPVLAANNLVIIESTGPVGTTEMVRDELAAAGAVMEQIRIAYCPERVIPGRILAELLSNDRIVGGVDEISASAARDFYASFVRGAIYTTTSRTAEMVKLVENSFRDVNIAFANEVSMLCHNLGIDSGGVIELANRHPRVNVLQPGVGVGGHCIAVDPWFLVSQDPATARLIRAARGVNDRKTEWVIDQIVSAIGALAGESHRQVRVACMGLAYKPDVDDLRESPAERIALTLAAMGHQVIACEPHLERHPTLPLADAASAVREADLVVLLVAHAAFRDLDLRGRNVLDFCGVTRTSVRTTAADRAQVPGAV